MRLGFTLLPVQKGGAEKSSGFNESSLNERVSVTSLSLSFYCTSTSLALSSLHPQVTSRRVSLLHHSWRSSLKTLCCVEEVKRRLVRSEGATESHSLPPFSSLSISFPISLRSVHFRPSSSTQTQTILSHALDGLNGVCESEVASVSFAPP